VGNFPKDYPVINNRMDVRMVNYLLSSNISYHTTYKFLVLKGS